MRGASQVVWVVHCADGKRRHDAAYVRKTKAQEYMRCFNRAGVLADLRCGPHVLVAYAPVRLGAARHGTHFEGPDTCSGQMGR